MKDQKEKNSWLGPKGYDEARYYQDENSDLGIDKPDERIKAKALEAISRNEDLKGCDIRIEVTDGVLKLQGEVSEDGQKDKAYQSVCFLTGIKSIINNLK